MREFNNEDRLRILLATSAIPFVFPKEKIGEYYYMDGGVPFGGDNIPLKPLIEIEHCDTVIVVHLERDVERKNIDQSLYPGIRILEIRPKDDQGGFFSGVLNFHADSAVRRILQGYNDTINMFRRIVEDRKMARTSAEKWTETAMIDHEASIKFNQRGGETELNYTEENITIKDEILDYVFSEQTSWDKNVITEKIMERFSNQEILDMLEHFEYLQGCDKSLVNSLNQDGSKHIIDFISGRERRNKKTLRVNFHNLLEISVCLQRALIRRLESSDDILRNLICREDQRDQEIKDRLDTVEKDLRDTICRSKGTEWIENIKFTKYFDGREYVLLEDSVKAYRIVADYCKTYGFSESDSEREKHIKTALDKLGIYKKEISVVEYYRAVLEQPEDVFLFYHPENEESIKIKNQLDEYGTILYNYPDFMRERAARDDVENEKLSDQFCEEAKNILKSRGIAINIDTFELCTKMIQREKVILKHIEKERQSIIKKAYQAELDERKRRAEEKRIMEERIRKENAQIMIITPEGARVIMGNQSKESVFPEVTKGIKRQMYEVSEEHKDLITNKYQERGLDILVLGAGLRAEDYPSLINKDTKLISLADYYMYLWFHSTEREIREGAKVAFVDYYDSDLYVCGYSVDSTGDSYVTMFSEKKISYKKNRNHIIEEIKSELIKTDFKEEELLQHGYSALFLNHQSMYIYRMFNFKNKLNKTEINTVNPNWEEYLFKPTDEFWDILCELKAIAD